MIRLLGLYREKECSPGRHQSNDALLLDEVACCLRARSDFSVELSTIEQLSARRPTATLVFSMCQGPAALDLLAGWERSGVPIVNSPRAARNTYRDRLQARRDERLLVVKQRFGSRSRPDLGSRQHAHVPSRGRRSPRLRACGTARTTASH